MRKNLHVTTTSSGSGAHPNKNVADKIVNKIFFMT